MARVLGSRDLRNLRAAYAEHAWRDPDGFHNEMFAASQAMREFRSSPTRTRSPRSSPPSGTPDPATLPSRP
jgi:hypothetical protein